MVTAGFSMAPSPLIPSAPGSTLSADSKRVSQSSSRETSRRSVSPGPRASASHRWAGRRARWRTIVTQDLTLEPARSYRSRPCPPARRRSATRVVGKNHAPGIGIPDRGGGSKRIRGCRREAGGARHRAESSASDFRLGSAEARPRAPWRTPRLDTATGMAGRPAGASSDTPALRTEPAFPFAPRAIRRASGPAPAGAVARCERKHDGDRSLERSHGCDPGGRAVPIQPVDKVA